VTTSVIPQLSRPDPSWPAVCGRPRRRRRSHSPPRSSARSMLRAPARPPAYVARSQASVSLVKRETRAPDDEHSSVLRHARHSHPSRRRRLATTSQRYRDSSNPGISTGRSRGVAFSREQHSREKRALPTGGAASPSSIHPAAHVPDGVNGKAGCPRATALLFGLRSSGERGSADPRRDAAAA
jgi:hypothetical protein